MKPRTRSKLEVCPTCKLPYGFVRCPVTIQGFTQCLSCGVLDDKKKRMLGE